MRRFYDPHISEETGTRTLDAVQSGHISKVLRLQSGNLVRVFDGSGNEFETRISELSRKSVRVEIVRKVSPSAPESNIAIRIGIPILKNRNSDLIVQKAVELGVTEIAPFVSKRSDVPMRKWNHERVHKIVIETAKQCGRATLPTILAPLDFTDLVATIQKPGILFYETDSGIGLPEIKTDQVTVITGPEGGWEESEVEFATENGIHIAHLGGRILKAETAAIVATALVQNAFGDLN